MFSSTTQEHLTASALAGDHLKAWEKTLAFRVSLQKPLDLANQLPITLDYQDAPLESLSEQLHNQVCVLSDLLDQQIVRDEKSLVGIKKKKTAVDDDLALWEQLYTQQTEFQTTRWEPVLNKWHARLNFGSEKTKAKLKVFTQSMWDQVEDTLTDEHRSVSKSRMPWDESRRLDKNRNTADGNDESEETKNEWSAPLSAQSSSKKSAKEGNKRAAQEVYDHEVYDDRMFYAMLLKTFITSASSGSGGAGGSSSGEGGLSAGVAGTMRAADLEALRQYKRKKLNVERKASKGRKVRYNVHDKLQNFMFPVGGGASAVENISIDAEKLFQSLFQ